MELVLANAGAVRTETWQGRDYFVVPMSILVPGVLNGSKGPLLYPEDECKANIGAWNGVPLVVNHPKDGDRYVSARQPAVLEKYGVGYAFNDRWEDGRRMVDGWFDVLRTRHVDSRVHDTLKAGKTFELSTGLGTTDTIANGAHNGVAYNAIARQYKPDHVAILPDSVGACSVKDGCGGNPSLGKRIRNLVGWLTGNVRNDVSQNDLRDELQEEVTERFGSGAWLVDVFPDDGYIVYQQNNGDLYRIGFTRTGVGVECELADEAPQPVDRITTYVPEPPEPTETTNVAQTKQQKVDHLIANCKCWEEGDRTALNSMTEQKLDLLIGAIQPKTPVVQPAPTVNVGEDPAFKQLVATVNSLAGTVGKLADAQTAPRIDAAIAKLTANADDATKPVLVAAYKKMDLTDLEVLAANVKAPESEAKPSYFGIAGGANNGGDQKWKDDVIVPQPTFTPEELAANAIKPRSANGQKVAAS